jgi:zinc D-Ala-D-Ala carboxypeptidase
MFQNEPSPSQVRARSTAVVALVLITAALIGVLGYLSMAAPSSSATSILAGWPFAHRAESLHGDRRGAADEADGVVPDHVTVFDDRYPAIANLDPALLGALRRAADDAANDGVRFYVDSGWRSRAYQEQLFEQAVSSYGSKQKAARWVAPPGTSAHESGKAVDIGPDDAAAWLSEHGARYGLCQIYRNEPWHFELRPDTVDDGCPRPYADATKDPRTHR